MDQEWAHPLISLNLRKITKCPHSTHKSMFKCKNAQVHEIFGQKQNRKQVNQKYMPHINLTFYDFPD